MKPQLDSIILYVQDVNLLKSFYTDLLGLEIVEEDRSGWVLLRGGRAYLGLHQMGAAYLEKLAPGYQQQNNTKIVLEIAEDINTRRQALLDRNVSLQTVKTFDNYEYWLCDGKDPEGNVFQLKQKKAISRESSGGTYRISNLSPQLLVADLERSLEFYTRDLGFRIAFRYGDFYSGITKDGFSLHLKAGLPSIAERAGEQTDQHVDMVFSVNAIEDIYETFVRKETVFLQPLRQMEYGKEFYLADPDGYVIAFVAETGSMPLPQGV